jgi:hypothetical protein
LKLLLRDLLLSNASLIQRAAELFEEISIIAGIEGGEGSFLPLHRSEDNHSCVGLIVLAFDMHGRCRHPDILDGLRGFVLDFVERSYFLFITNFVFIIILSRCFNFVYILFS